MAGEESNKAMEVLPKALTFAHHLVEQAIKPGEWAIDATAGNGKDTEWLARLVGSEGLVYAFDVQEKALERTRERLQDKGLLSRTKLILQGHEHLKKHVLPEMGSRIEKEGGAGAVMFNLGFLPGSDHRVITKPETTIEAISQAMELLKRGGVITMVIYTGHSGGVEEKEMIYEHLAELEAENLVVLSYRFMNQGDNPPELVAIEKK